MVNNSGTVLKHHRFGFVWYQVFCFGLGDSQYWPRKEDKHYYNKPAKDLFAKLKLYGGVELADIGLGDDQDADGFLLVSTNGFQRSGPH